ncbi:uncharacterized protein IUM83_06633 [Phytophthora cinnamomi]|uniref:uncharacterized protein n=1 Tax=Phytophthora cinnamomi TaxID=4785 RepID=UPI00355A7A1B|nr:hypothetical protein IUM83_06633 [Phytophthora cinnamomi]
MRADNPTEPVYFTPPSYENLDFSDELLWTESESLPETMVSPPKKIMRSQRQYNRRSKPQKPKKQKIRTYTRRQTEIKALKGELKQLNQQMDSYGEQAHMMRERARLVQQQRTNKDLVEALRLQRLSFSTTAAMLSQFIHSKMTGPFDALTKLGIDACGRHAALLAMRHDRLQFARQFMLRQRQLLGFDEYCERKKFKADNGDLVSLNYEIIPLPGARSIKSMVEALQRFVHNIEINISEATGDVTVRENDDAMPDSAVTQHRLVTKIGNAMESESNNVAFGEYYPASPGLLEQALTL